MGWYKVFNLAMLVLSNLQMGYRLGRLWIAGVLGEQVCIGQIFFHYVSNLQFQKFHLHSAVRRRVLNPLYLFFIFFWEGFWGMHHYQCRFICIVILHHVYFREIIWKMKLMFMSKSEMAFLSEAILVWQKAYTH